MKSVPSSPYSFIDLFAGVGGMRLAFEQEGFQCVFSSEIDKHASQMYALNHGEQPKGDITAIASEDIPPHDVLLAGFPCQPFSRSGKLNGFDDTRGTLFFEVIRIARDKQPRMIVLENVKNLIYHDNKRTLRVVLDSLIKLGYTVNWRVLNGKDFGLPQSRERIIIVAALHGLFDFDALQLMPPVALEDFLDTTAHHEYLSPDMYTLLPNELVKQQKTGLIFTGYLNKKIRAVGVNPTALHHSRTHKQPYRIYDAKGTNPTLSSQETSGRYYILHNEKVRKLSLHECFRIMGFPHDFKLIMPTTECYKRIGNSVCIPMLAAIARQVTAQLNISNNTLAI